MESKWWFVADLYNGLHGCLWLFVADLYNGFHGCLWLFVADLYNGFHDMGFMTCIMGFINCVLMRCINCLLMRCINCFFASSVASSLFLLQRPQLFLCCNCLNCASLHQLLLSSGFVEWLLCSGLVKWDVCVRCLYHIFVSYLCITRIHKPISV